MSRIPLITAACSLLLTACATAPTTVEQVNAYNAKVENECKAKGYKPGTQDFQTCIALAVQPDMNAANTAMAVGAGLSIGSALIGALSDVRAKRDIVKLGELSSGIGLYRFRYYYSKQILVGVLAQEVQRVRPGAVIRGGDGYLRVDYRQLGTRLMTWEEWVGPSSTLLH